MALFEHMCEFRRLHSSQDEPPKFLGVAMTAEQKVIIAPTMADLMVGQILKDAGGDGATMRSWHHQPLRVAEPPKSD
jgi:hypothetical protein